ncbi:DsbA family oxidoreductase [Zobellia galactanivorans]|uniref:DSBA thioredoxin family protein n=1 Tax=Zobellia galactanivorans (strain DSM 12802 / CCUG 47099 / CIP 106680 / NCIMB 13871 / Dsij) TaxID=63186 RepID=G0LCS1_ZOBGA|nr:DsbA family oxidoreductase [Zobellia galactanivorans]MBU3025094.1 DsbA family oxidoreductase [Zobellia galactanivorans]MDO6810513.1 DsbA family oxidoreductase [Zobellia galactanivorans]CAZ97141.1 DSBA thioredoxin family protein [Zobellia galactanivorans]
MAEKIKIDLVSDVVCPWCVIGYKRLERAISEMGIEDKIELEWQPFELNPHMPPEGQNVQEHLTEKYGSSLEDQKLSQERMTEFGEELGFTFDYFDDMRMANTRDAHVLLEYAHEKGKQTELKMRLVTAFFSERKDVSKRAVLAEELKAVGLNAEEAMARLDDDNARYEVTSKEQYWQGLGVSSVPTFVFDKKSALTGAQPVEVFKQVLTELIEK